jgi:uncharacterized HAD superfamily protein
MKIGIDLDNTITECPDFFSLMTNAFSPFAEIFIITNREKSAKSLQEIELELEKMNVFYQKIIITSEKADFIIKNKIDIFFDDTDEYFLELPEKVKVFKIREAGNFDFEAKKWIYGRNTGINIDDKSKKS